MTTPWDEQAETLLADAGAGKPTAVARAITAIESGGPLAAAVLGRLRPAPLSCEKIGITGPPGTGKSTLVAALGGYLRQSYAADALAVVAVDPSSPYTRGALLGDRFRMTALAADSRVFIRSMASRGALGGLAVATEDACDLLAHAGYPRVIVETVGVGQNEVEIASACDVTVVVLNPESGDSVQALKAGLMEVADVVVVNKADLDGADRFVSDVQAGLELRGGAAHRHVPVVRCVATQGTGAAELWTAIADIRKARQSDGGLLRLRESRLQGRTRDLWLSMLRDAVGENEPLASELARVTGDVRARKASPYAAARAMLDFTLAQFRAGRFTPDDVNAALTPKSGETDTRKFKQRQDTESERLSRDTRKHLEDLGPGS